jgi:hypothetical protein
MSITKNGRFISVLFMLAALSCNNKPKVKLLMIAPDFTVRNIDVDARSYKQILNVLPDLANKKAEYWDKYLLAFSNKVKYLPTDSLIPRMYPIADFPERSVYSISWGEVAENKAKEGFDTIKGKNGKIWHTIRWRSVAKGKIIFPERGVSISIDIPFSYRYNCITGAYDYFSSAQEGYSCPIAMSGPAFGELEFPMHQVMNFSSGESAGDGFNGWANGIAMITERRYWLKFTNNNMKFLYGAAPVVKRTLSEALNDPDIETTARTVEMYEFEFIIRFKTPDELISFKPVNTTEDFTDRNDLPVPRYVLTVSGRFRGIQHN